MQYPAYSFSQGKDTGPAPHKGAAGGTLRPRGGAAVSCYPTRSPPYFPSVTRHTPKAFWKPPKAVSKAEPFAALGEAPLTPFASPGAAHAPSAPHFRPATSQGSGGGAAPSRGPGARPPLAVAEPISISASAPPFLSDLAQTLLLRHEKGPANAGPFRLSKKWLAPLFRDFHSSLAPTARPGSYAGKPLLRKAFCGFDAHVAKSDYSLRGLRPPSPQGVLDKLKGPANAEPFNLFFILFTR